ncbi:MAG: hypothetical protein CNLJKLNK_00636 [Holosporales bacterium]
MKSVIKRPRHKSNNRPHRPHQNNDVMTADGNFEHEERLDYRPPRNRTVLQQHIDKYLNQAREAISSGDRVAAENFLQHADHFNRLLNEQKEIRQQHEQKRQPYREPAQNQMNNHDQAGKDASTSGQIQTATQEETTDNKDA